MREEFVKKFEKVAHAVAIHALKDSHKNNPRKKFWELVDDTTTWEWKFVNNSEIQFSPVIDGKHHPYAHISFKAIAPNKIVSSDIGPAVVSNEAVSGADSRKFTNSSDTPINWTYNYLEENASYVNQDAGVKAAFKFKQEFWYGNGEGSDAGGFGGKSTIDIEIEGHYNKHWGESTKEVKEQSLSVEVPPNSYTEVSQTRAIGKYKQSTTIVADVSYEIHVNLPEHIGFAFNKSKDLLDAMAGYFPEGTDDTGRAIAYWKKNPVSKEDIDALEKAMSGIVVEVTDDVEFEKATTGNIIVKSQAL